MKRQRVVPDTIAPDLQWTYEDRKPRRTRLLHESEPVQVTIVARDPVSDVDAGRVQRTVSALSLGDRLEAAAWYSARSLPRQRGGYQQIMRTFKRPQQRLAACALPVAFLAVSCSLLISPLASGAPRLECHFGTAHYNTVLCGLTKRKGGEECARVSHEAPGVPVAGYVAGSTSAYRTRFQAEGLTGCDPAGVRTVTYFQELRNGTEGAFVRSGRITTRATNARFKIDEVQSLPYNCGVDAPGSAVRAVVRLTWHPSKGWGGGQSTPDELVSTPSAICPA